MNPQFISRRTFLGSLALAAAASQARIHRARGAGPPPPRETGLSSEGLLAGEAGFQPRTIAPLRHAELPGFLSRVQLAANYLEYNRSVESLKSVEAALASAERDPANNATYGALRRQQVANANSVLLHEFYFASLAPAKVEVPSYVQRHMNEHMGSVESWAADFTACALAAKAWAALVYDPYDDRWHNVAMDADADGAWIGGNPLLVCDVAEHAYSTDYQRREEYVAKFLDHIDWDIVAKRYHRVDRM